MRPAFAASLAFAFLLSGANTGARGQSMGSDEVALGAPDRSFREMVLDCGGNTPHSQVMGACQAGALAAIAGRGAMGLSSSLGSETPGSATTIGRRVSNAPRLSFGFRAGAVRASSPGLEGGSASPGSKETGYLTSAHLTGTVGILDGFSPVPNVRGLLSLDLLASGHWVSGSPGLGLGEGEFGWGVGGRVGILRESFTLPGIVLSLTRRSLGTVRIGDMASGDWGEGEFETRVSSLRGVVGKDIAGVGFLAGLGQDRYSGAVDVSVDPLDTGQTFRAVSGDLETSRWLIFGGASMTFLILQLSGEVGWAQGFHPDLVVDSGAQPAGEKAYFGFLAGRVTF